MNVIEYRHDERFELGRLLGTRHAKHFCTFEGHLARLADTIEKERPAVASPSRTKSSGAKNELIGAFDTFAIQLLADANAATTWDGAGKDDARVLEIYNNDAHFKKHGLAPIKLGRSEGWLFQLRADLESMGVHRLASGGLVVMGPEIGYWKERGNKRFVAAASALAQEGRPGALKPEGVLDVTGAILIARARIRGIAKALPVAAGKTRALKGEGYVVALPPGRYAFARTKPKAIADVGVGRMFVWPVT